MNTLEKIFRMLYPKKNKDCLLYTDSQGKPIEFVQLFPKDTLENAIKETSCKLDKLDVYIQYAALPVAPPYLSLNKLSTVNNEHKIPKHYLPDVLFYLQNHTGISYDTIPAEYTKENYTEYLKSIHTAGIPEMKREIDFLKEACDGDSLALMNDSQKTKELCLEIMHHFIDNASFKNVPWDIKDYEFTSQVCCEPWTGNLRYIRTDFSNEQVYKLVEKNSRNLEDDYFYTPSVSLAKFLSQLPPAYLEKDLSDHFGKELWAYVKVINNIPTTREEIFDSVKFYAQHRYIKCPTRTQEKVSYFEGEHDYSEDHPNSKMDNPIRHFPPGTLSPLEWHTLAEIDTNLINEIPKVITGNKEFWQNYQSFIGKGRFLHDNLHPSQNRFFFQNEVLPNMPIELKQDKAIISDLYQKKLISKEIAESCLKEMPVPEERSRKRGLAV